MSWNEFYWCRQLSTKPLCETNKFLPQSCSEHCSASQGLLDSLPIIWDHYFAGVPGRNPSLLGAGHLSKVFAGDIPWSPDLEWLQQRKGLHEMALTAHRSDPYYTMLATLACRCDGERQRNVVRLIFAHSAQPCASDQGPWPSVLPLWGDSETNTVGDMKRNKKNISNVKKLRVSLMPWSNRPRKAGLKIDSSAPSCGYFWQNTGILNLLRTQPVIHGLECCWLNTKINVFVIT